MTAALSENASRTLPSSFLGSAMVSPNNPISFAHHFSGISQHF
jgi:hypothetical protein